METLSSTQKTPAPGTEGPLSGVRVLEWAVNQQGPVAAMMLGYLGAEVIKIEQRGIGDPARAMGGINGRILPPAVAGGSSYFFETLNRNKKSITVDLKKQRGKEIIYRLAAKTDVFIENFRTTVPGKLGLDYETLRRYNPRLIYGAATGWGAEGPEAAKPALDPAAQARSGFMLNIGEANMPPLYGPGGTADRLGGALLAYGILAALFSRDRTGVGQIVNTSLLGSMIWLQEIYVSYTLLFGGEIPRRTREKAANALHNLYRCADDKWICLCMGQSQRYWHDFCLALGLQALEHDTKFGDEKQRRAHAEELVSILDRVFAGKPRARWLRILEKQRDFIYAPVNCTADLAQDPQAIANKYTTDFDQPGLGRIKVVGSPVSFSGAEVGPISPAPECGQHTEEVLLEIGGYTWEEIGQFKELEVI